MAGRTCWTWRWRGNGCRPWRCRRSWRRKRRGRWNRLAGREPLAGDGDGSAALTAFAGAAGAILGRGELHTTAGAGETDHGGDSWRDAPAPRRRESAPPNDGGAEPGDGARPPAALQ